MIPLCSLFFIQFLFFIFYLYTPLKSTSIRDTLFRPTPLNPLFQHTLSYLLTRPVYVRSKSHFTLYWPLSRKFRHPWRTVLGIPVPSTIPISRLPLVFDGLEFLECQFLLPFLLRGSLISVSFTFRCWYYEKEWPLVTSQTNTISVPTPPHYLVIDLKQKCFYWSIENWRHISDYQIRVFSDVLQVVTTLTVVWFSPETDPPLSVVYRPLGRRLTLNQLLGAVTPCCLESWNVESQLLFGILSTRSSIVLNSLPSTPYGQTHTE